MSATPSAARTARRILAPLAIAAAGAIALSACAGGSSTPAATADTSSPYYADLPQAVKDAGKLSVLVQTPAAPFEFTEEGGTELTGIDVELARKAGEIIGLPVEFTQVSDFSNLFPGLQAGRADVVWSGALDKKERQEFANIVDYFQTGTVVMKKTGDNSLKTYADLCGKTVASSAGTNYPAQIEELSKEYCGGDATAIQQLNSSAGIPDLINQLLQGRVQAVVNGSDFLPYEVSQNFKGQLEVLGEPVLNPAYYGVVVSKDKAGLEKVIQEVLQSMVDDGSYAEILEKYGVQDSALDKITINIAK